MIEGNIRKYLFWFLDFLKGSPILKNLKEIQNINNSNDQALIEKYINKRLGELLKYAKNNVPYYQKYERAELSDFPIINKLIIRDNFDDFRSVLFINKKTYQVVTSGSTGLPFKIIQNQNKKYRNTADTIYYASKANYSLGNILVYMKIWNKFNRKSNLKKILENIYPVNVLNLSDHEIKKIICDLNKQKEIHILAYVSAIEAICSYIKRNNVTFSFSVKSVITMSESLPEKSRIFIQKTLKTHVFSRYSNVENGIIAQQLNSTSHFYVNIASYYVEVLNLDIDIPVKEGEIGRIVVTDLFNYAMPIIRYDTGDIGILETDSRGIIILTSIEGRKMDAIYNTNGQLLSSFIVTNSMWNYSELLQYQFIQTGEKSYTFKLNIKKVFDREEELQKEFLNFLGNDAKIQIEYVDEIPLLDSGKRKKVVNIWKNYKV